MTALVAVIQLLNSIAVYCKFSFLITHFEDRKKRMQKKVTEYAVFGNKYH